MEVEDRDAVGGRVENCVVDCYYGWGFGDGLRKYGGLVFVGRDGCDREGLSVFVDRLGGANVC